MKRNKENLGRVQSAKNAINKSIELPTEQAENVKIKQLLVDFY
jgi:hypothetical protein